MKYNQVASTHSWSIPYYSHEVVRSWESHTLNLPKLTDNQTSRVKVQMYNDIITPTVFWVWVLQF